MNGESNHFLNANRISALIPKPGEVENWTLVNGGGGWDHPVHLHFEEGVTIDRGGKAYVRAGKNSHARTCGGLAKWAGADSGPLRRIRRCLRQPLPQHRARGLRHAAALRHTDRSEQQEQFAAAYFGRTPTPNPTPDGVEYMTPEILPEGNPFSKNFKRFPKASS